MSSRGPVLVTGAGGFLAAWIVPELLARGREVIALDLRRDERRLAAVCGQAPDIAWHTADLADAGAFATLAETLKPSAIVHLAALQIPACRADPVAGARVNVIGHIGVLQAAARLGCRVVYTSSVAAKPRGPANAPANLYGVYKRAGEEIARLFHADQGVSSLGLRPHVVYGVGRDQGETAAVTAAMQAAAEGQTYTIPWRTRTCFQYAGDIAALFAAAVDAPWQGAIVSDMTDRVESTDDVLAAIAAAAPGAAVTLQGPERVSPVDGFDVAPLAGIVGGIATTSLLEGTARTIEAFRRLARR